MFGLSQGGIVPSYAVIVREYLPAHEAGQRVGIVIMATQPGEFVKEVSLDNPYWARHFASAGRPVKGPVA